MKTSFEVKYNGFNITDSIEKDLISIRYTDNITSNADDIEIVMDNRDGRWYDSQLPVRGDVIECRIGELICGSFEIDAPKFSLAPGQTVSLRAQSVKVSSGKAIIPINRSYNNTTFQVIIKEMADLIDLKAYFYCGDFTIKSITFFQKTPTQIVYELCQRYGFNSKVSSRFGEYGEEIVDKLIITEINDFRILNHDSSLEIIKGETPCSNLSIEFESKTYVNKIIQYRDPTTRQLTQITETDKDNSLKYQVNARKSFQGEFTRSEVGKIAAAIKKQTKIKGRFSMKGTVKALAGSKLLIKGFDNGIISQTTFIIITASHRLSASTGWICEGEFINV
jgi:phage protein D